METRMDSCYKIEIPVYFPEFKKFGRTVNLSLGGCCVVMNAPVEHGTNVDVILNLPVIGPLLMNGTLRCRQGDPAEIGLETVEVDFLLCGGGMASYPLYARFIHSLGIMDDIRQARVAMEQSGKMPPCIYPDCPFGRRPALPQPGWAAEMKELHS